MGYYPGAYNPYYSYGRPTMPMNYYQPMPVQPSSPMMTAAPATVPTLPPTVTTDSSPTTIPAPVTSSQDSTPVMMRRPYTPLPAYPMFIAPTDGGACGDQGQCGPECIQRDECEKPCSPWMFDFGGAANYVKPFFHSDPAFVVSSGAVAGVPTTGTAPEFGFDWTVNPSVWAEITSPSGVGFRTQYFRFDQKSDTVSAAVPGGAGASITPLVSPLAAIAVAPFVVAGGTFTASSNLKLETIDLETTYSWRPQHWLLTLQAGARYMDTEQNYTGRGASAAGATIQTVAYHQSFAGAGPLVGFEFHRFIARTGLAAYGKVDGALLVGQGFESLSQTIPAAAGIFVSSNHDALLPVADIELGVEYIFNRTRKFQPFIRGAVVDQTYWDIGNASSRNGNMSLFGGQLTGGFSF
jgi:hypothetical protein